MENPDLRPTTASQHGLDLTLSFPTSLDNFKRDTSWNFETEKLSGHSEDKKISMKTMETRGQTTRDRCKSETWAARTDNARCTFAQFIL